MRKIVLVIAGVFVIAGAITMFSAMQQYWLKEGLTVMWPDEIDDLSAKICSDTENDKEKVQAIYNWII